MMQFGTIDVDACFCFRVSRVGDKIGFDQDHPRMWWVTNRIPPHDSLEHSEKSRISLQEDFFCLLLQQLWRYKWKPRTVSSPPPFRQSSWVKKYLPKSGSPWNDLDYLLHWLVVVNSSPGRRRSFLSLARELIRAEGKLCIWWFF